MGKKERQMALSRAGKGKSSKVQGNGQKFRGNAFDVQKNSRTKYEVLGKRVKGQGRNVAQARAEAEERRHQTLKKQFQLRRKKNDFKDRRLGEKNEDMSLEDKMIARFQTERKRQYQQQRNATKFNLNDSDESGREEDILTHRGSKIDDYDTFVGREEESDEEDKAFEHKLGRELVSQLHFGGGESAAQTEGKKRSHEEIMHEVMMKSKMFKAEKQKNKADQDETTEALDAEFADFQKMLDFRPKKSDQTMEARGELDEFDVLARTLALEAKAKASERKLTPEEIAKKEHETLAKLEKQRIARMNGEDESDDESKKKNKKGFLHKPQLVLMPPTDDALMDGYEIDRSFMKANATSDDEDPAEAASEDDNDDFDEDHPDASEEENHVMDEDDTVGASEKEEDRDEYASSRSSSEESDEDDISNDDNNAKKRRRDEAAKEMPYVLPCPETLSDLTALFDQYTSITSERHTVLERLRKYYSPKISVDNARKMKTLLAILMDHFVKLASDFDTHRDDLDMISRHIYNLAHDIPDVAGLLFRDFVMTLVKKTTTTTATSANKKKHHPPPTLPEMRELLLLRLALSIFPVTDFRHKVVSPIELFLGQCLSRSSKEILTNPESVRRALFCICLSLHTTKGKSKFAPEVIFSLASILDRFLDGTFGVPSKKKSSDIVDVPPLPLQKTPTTPPLDHALFMSTLITIEAAVEQYASIPSFYELFATMISTLTRLKKKFAVGGSQMAASIRAIQMHGNESLKSRRPLQLQTFAPTVLPSLAPRFEENYAMRKDKTADRDKAQLKQLQRQVKRERKGASRELRLDAAYVARQRMEEHATWKKEKDEKQREIRAWLQEQNATFNQQVRKGGELLKGGGAGGAKKRRMSKKTHLN